MKNDISSFLVKTRRKSVKIAPNLEDLIRGSVVRVERVCGKKNCMCRNGLKHRSMYISQSVRGKTRMTYIPKRSENKAFRLVENYRKLRVIIGRVSEYNIMLLTTPKTGAKKD